MIETAQAFGVDIGGSGIKAAPVSRPGRFARATIRRILTPEVSTPQAVAKIVKQQLDHFEVPESAPVGIACPAPIGRPDSTMANADDLGLAWTLLKCSPKPAGRSSCWRHKRRQLWRESSSLGAAKGPGWV